MIIKPTVIERYSVINKGILDKNSNNPRPARRYTTKTARIYILPKNNILPVERFAPINTDNIKINTPIAQGLIESIAAVVNTIPNVGKYASTANQITFLNSDFVCFTDVLCSFFFRSKFNNETISWRNIKEWCWQVM